MALKLKVERKDNHLRAEFPNAYHRIFEVNVNKSDNNVRINIRVYADKEARDYKESSQDSPGMPSMPHIQAGSLRDETVCATIEKFDEVSGELFAKAYEYLKKHEDKFMDAEDC